jgi:hypothetical protein
VSAGRKIIATSATGHFINDKNIDIFLLIIFKFA